MNFHRRRDLHFSPFCRDRAYSLRSELSVITPGARRDPARTIPGSEVIVDRSAATRIILLVLGIVGGLALAVSGAVSEHHLFFVVFGGLAVAFGFVGCLL